MRQNGHGALTLEDARTWIEETGLCLFLPRRQFSTSTAPSFVEAVAGQQNSTPDQRHIALAEELLVRLELDGIAVRLNLLGQPGEQPDFVVAAWVLPYVYALRGDRDWRRNPQLTGSRQVSPLAVQAYKHLEQADSNLSELKHLLGREVTDAAVLRAITELWQQLRIIPVVAAPGVSAKWQLLRHRFQKAIAEGASTSQVTAISVLASIYLQAVIAASMEDVELFLAPLTARSKVREVLRGLVATRQVHTISMGHAPHFYVAGTLPEFAIPQTSYTSSSMPAFFLYGREHEDDMPAPEPARILTPPSPISTISHHVAEARPATPPPPPQVHVETRVLHTPAASNGHANGNGHKPISNGKAPEARPRFNRPAPHGRDRKVAQSLNGSRPARRSGPGARPVSGSRPGTSSRPASSSRQGTARPVPARPGTSRPGTSRPTSARPGTARPVSSRPASSRPGSSRPVSSRPGQARPTSARPGSPRPSSPSRWNSNGGRTNGSVHKTSSNGARNGSEVTRNGRDAGRNGNGGRPSNGSSSSRNGKSAAPAWNKHNGHSSNGHSKNGHSGNGHMSGAKPAGKAAPNGRNGSVTRNGASARKDTRPGHAPAHAKNGKPALTAGAKAGNSKRYGFTARPERSSKKRG